MMEPQTPPPRRLRVLVAATGSVAGVKVPQLVAALQQRYDVKVMATERAREFLELREPLPTPTTEVLTDAHEWGQWKQVGDEVLHNELRRWADMLV